MRIDLHMHSFVSKTNGDSIIWESNFHVAKTLFEHNVKMAAITDHNMFNDDLYLDLRNKCQGAGLVFLPGVEVNVVRLNGMIGHLLIIFRPDLSDQEIHELANKIKHSIPRYGVALNKVNDFFSEYETIRIPHVGKSDFFGYEDLLQLKYDAFEVTNLEHKNYLSVSNKLTSSVVCFSDTHMWNNYPQQKQFITIVDLETPSFAELKSKLAENKNYMEEI